MKPYRKFPPDFDGLGLFLVALVAALILIAVLRLT